MSGRCPPPRDAEAHRVEFDKEVPDAVYVTGARLPRHDTMINPATSHNRSAGGLIPRGVLLLPPLITAAGFAVYFLVRKYPLAFWAFNVWDYLRPPIPLALKIAAVIVSLPPLLLYVVNRLDRTEGTSRTECRKPRRQIRAGLFAIGVFAALWLLSEKRSQACRRL
jgi:hypothetical protein